MKLSKETLAIFKNFASINTNLLIKPGNVISTMATNKTVLAKVTVAETFTEEFGIYDLGEFLGALSLFESPELEFDKKFVQIKESSESIKFYSADASVLIAPTKDIKFPDADVVFNLTANQLAKIQKTASVLRASDLTIRGEDGKMTLLVGDKKNVTGNSFSTEVGDTDKKFTININVDNLKMLPGDYTVSVSNKKISQFKSDSTDLIYYVAVEADSVID